MLKLYLPAGGMYFGSREAYGLTYTSCQESGKYDGVNAGAMVQQIAGVIVQHGRKQEGPRSGAFLLFEPYT